MGREPPGETGIINASQYLLYYSNGILSWFVYKRDAWLWLCEICSLPASTTTAAVCTMLRLGTTVKVSGRRSTRTFATHAPPVEKDCSSITPPYGKLLQNLQAVRKIVKRPLTLSEKILYSHVHEPERALVGKGDVRGEYLQLMPQRVAMQDASAQQVLHFSIPYHPC